MSVRCLYFCIVLLRTWILWSIKCFAPSNMYIHCFVLKFLLMYKLCVYFVWCCFWYANVLILWFVFRQYFYKTLFTVLFIWIPRRSFKRSILIVSIICAITVKILWFFFFQFYINIIFWLGCRIYIQNIVLK